MRTGRPSARPAAKRKLAEPSSTTTVEPMLKRPISAPRATGNVATEDLLYLLEGEGVETGVDLDALVGVAAWLEGVLGRRLEGQVYRAGLFPSSTAPADASSAISGSE